MKLPKTITWNQTPRNVKWSMIQSAALAAGLALMPGAGCGGGGQGSPDALKSSDSGLVDGKLIRADGAVPPPSDGAAAKTDGAVTNDCWDGTTLPRPALDPTPLPSAAAAYSAWRDAMAKYQADAAQYSQESAAHAAAYAAAATGVVGRPCTSDSDCATGSAAFPGTCHIYYQHGQCEVADPNPPVGPTPPPQPALTCADFTCAPSYQCEQEATTRGIACVLQRCKSGGKKDAA